MPLTYERHPGGTIGAYVPIVQGVVVVINEFRCYEAKMEESEKAGSRQKSPVVEPRTPLA